MHPGAEATLGPRSEGSKDYSEGSRVDRGVRSTPKPAGRGQLWFRPPGQIAKGIYPRKEKFGDGENLTKKTAPGTKGSEKKGRSNENHQTNKQSLGTKPEQKKAFEAKGVLQVLETGIYRGWL